MADRAQVETNVSTPARARVLVVDDSVVVRKVLSEAIATDRDLEVIGTAPNGRLALAKMRASCPDVVTLDIEMPDMDGLEALQVIRQEFPNVRVLMCSTLTANGASATIDALARGAHDYILKPSLMRTDGNLVAFGVELVGKLRAIVGRRDGLLAPAPIARPVMLGSAPTPAPSRAALAVAPPPTQPRKDGPIDIIGIGVSTGGPNALAALIPTLPASLRVPVVIVQHMPPLFTKMLADRLKGLGSLPVKEAEAGEKLKPGTVYLAPGDFHMSVKAGAGGMVLNIDQAAQENSCRPAVDVLFRSLAQLFGSRVLAVMLTGMGKDGLKGCEQIHARGGRILAQDERTSVVWGMPGFVVGAGLAEEVLPIEAMGPAIVRRLGGARPAGTSS